MEIYKFVCPKEERLQLKNFLENFVKKNNYKYKALYKYKIIPL